MPVWLCTRNKANWRPNTQVHLVVVVVVFFLHGLNLGIEPVVGEVPTNNNDDVNDVNDVKDDDQLPSGVTTPSSRQSSRRSKSIDILAVSVAAEAKANAKKDVAQIYADAQVKTAELNAKAEQAKADAAKHQADAQISTNNMMLEFMKSTQQQMFELIKANKTN